RHHLATGRGNRQRHAAVVVATLTGAIEGADDARAIHRPAQALVGKLADQPAARGITLVAGPVGEAACLRLVLRQARLAFEVTPGHVHAALHLTAAATPVEVADGGTHLRRRALLEVEFVEFVAALLVLVAAAQRQQLPRLGQVLRQADRKSTR